MHAARWPRRHILQRHGADKSRDACGAGDRAQGGVLGGAPRTGQARAAASSSRRTQAGCGRTRLQAALERVPAAREGRQQVPQRVLAAAARRHDVAALAARCRAQTAGARARRTRQCNAHRQDQARS